MSKFFQVLGGLILIGILGFGLLFVASPKFKKAAQMKAVDKMGDVAVKRMASNPSTEGSVAADFINIPIAAREIADGIWQATGVGNAHVITTSGKAVLFDTGLPTQAPKQIKVLNEAIEDLALSHIIVSHSHADHAGGVKFWHEDGTEIVAHAEFTEEQRYLTELQDYFWGRNRTLFPFMPEKPPTIGLIAYGGINPTMTVANGQPYKFSQGGVAFELHALPGAEGADNLVLWLPERKILFSGDFFGPLFPQFPNIFTMRGEKIRKPIEYVNSLQTIIDLGPEMIVPSHKDPITDAELIQKGLVKMRDATLYVHDQTITGMNAGKTLEQVMGEVELPPELALTQEHGKVSWAVKSIWEYYATWFHFDKTTELYNVPANSVYKDVVELAGEAALIAKAQAYVDAGEPLKALHITNLFINHKPADFNDLTGGVFKVEKQALEALLEQAKSTHNNSYEIYWLNFQLRENKARLDSQ